MKIVPENRNKWVKVALKNRNKLVKIVSKNRNKWVKTVLKNRNKWIYPWFYKRKIVFLHRPLKTFQSCLNVNSHHI